MATATDPTNAIHFSTIDGRGAGWYWLVASLLGLMIAGAFSAHYMEVEGHRVTGMTNQIVWGIPHVFAIFLIVSASGALNAATLASVAGRAQYRSHARLSGLLAVALLIGGLVVLVLDLGRPDRLMVALTHFNFKSVFAWNVFLYTGFIALVIGYLCVLMQRRPSRHASGVGWAVLAWRLILTTGTGLIFGFLVARQAYDAAIMAPLFIAMSLSLGTAAYTVVALAAFRWSGRRLDDDVVAELGRLMAVFVAVVLYFVLVSHAARLYAAGDQGVERFLLVEGGVYTGLFWIGQVVAGSVLPLWIFLSRRTARSRSWVASGAALVMLGGLAQLYVIIIGGQAYPLAIFPGKEIVESSFYDGVVGHYRPSVPELALGLGGVATSLLIVVLSLKALPFLPVTRDRE